MDAHNEVMRKTRDMRKYDTLIKATEVALRIEEGRSTPEASILSLYNASQDAQKALVMCVRQGR
jgi:hypothetical protein